MVKPMKRVFDFIAALTGLILLSPVLIIVMVLIWKQDFHSPFYNQYNQFVREFSRDITGSVGKKRKEFYHPKICFDFVCDKCGLKISIIGLIVF